MPPFRRISEKKWKQISDDDSLFSFVRFFAHDLLFKQTRKTLSQKTGTVKVCPDFLKLRHFFELGKKTLKKQLETFERQKRKKSAFGYFHFFETTTSFIFCSSFLKTGRCVSSFIWTWELDSQSIPALERSHSVWAGGVRIPGQTWAFSVQNCC